LTQIAEAELAAADHFAGVEFFLAQEDAAEGRLAGAVAADEAHLLVVGERAAGAVEEVLVAIAFVGVVELEDYGHARGFRVEG
jgi:hypothetical protein